MVDSTLVGVWASDEVTVLVIVCSIVCVAEGGPEVVTVKLLSAEEEREKDGDGVTVLHGVVVRVCIIDFECDGDGDVVRVCITDFECDGDGVGDRV